MIKSGKTEHERLTLSPPEFGRIVGVGRNGSYELVRAGKVRSLKVGNKVLIPKSEVERFLATAA